MFRHIWQAGRRNLGWSARFGGRTNNMRIGVFGGSFDPVHLGHLRLAECCRDQAKLDRVRFTPAKRQPLKPTGPRASDEDRVAMLELAIAGRDGFEISKIELVRGGVSYTADTLAQMHRSAPEDELYFLLGADSLADFGQWVRPAEICRLATLLVVQRPDLADPNVDDLKRLLGPIGVESRLQVAKMNPTPISSSRIRQQIAAGKSSWRSSIPSSVAEYIERQRIYR